MLQDNDYFICEFAYTCKHYCMYKYPIKILHGAIHIIFNIAYVKCLPDANMIVQIKKYNIKEK